MINERLGLVGRVPRCRLVQFQVRGRVAHLVMTKFYECARGWMMLLISSDFKMGVRVVEPAE